MPTLIALAKLIGVPDDLIDNATPDNLPPRPEPGTETSVKRAAKDYSLDVATLWRWVRRDDMGIKVIREPSGPGKPLIIDASTVWPIAKEYHLARGKGQRTAIRYAAGRRADAVERRSA